MNRLSKNSGFTLVEISIVLAVIGILLTIAIPSFRQMMAHMKLKNAASQLYSEMSKARMAAVHDRETYVVNFDLAGTRLTVAQKDGGWSSTAGGDDWRGLVIYRDESDPDVLFFAADSISFYSDGTSNAEGEKAAYIKTEPYNGERYRVSVVGSTGKVSMEHWDGEQWKSGY